jgi:hypothetical protein
MDDTQPPTDQLPLAALLDMLDLKTVNLGDWMNWPVSKIGGQEAVVPKEVIGAHGGFLSPNGRSILNRRITNCCSKVRTTPARCVT